MRKLMFATAFLLLFIGMAGTIRAEVIQSFCSDSRTLNITRSEFVYNGTQWINVIYSTNITCNQNVTCSNNTFNGPSCDPPLLQQPLYLAGYGLLGIIALGTIVFILKKVI